MILKPDISSSFASLETEQRNTETMELDRLEGLELVTALHRENYQPARSIEPALPVIASLIEVIAYRLERGGRLIYVGAGTSGRLGVLDASECPPTFGVPPDMVQGIIAGGEAALRSSIEGAEDSRESGVEAVRSRYVSPGDIVVGIAASGRTPFVIGALIQARSAGAVTAAIVNVAHSELENYADYTVAVVTGPEPLTGSTRLKAGTAQKMILNLLTTGAMTRMGKIYQNLMVDMRATNSKLRDRAQRIVSDAANVDKEQAIKALEESDWECKTAIVMIKSGVCASKARSRLLETEGRVRAAIHE